jgi:hypothetical protein
LKGREEVLRLRVEGAAWRGDGAVHLAEWFRVNLAVEGSIRNTRNSRHRTKHRAHPSASLRSFHGKEVHRRLRVVPAARGW